jgi:hypothetical protein
VGVLGELEEEVRQTNMEIKRVGTQHSAKEASDWFTGTIRLFQASDPALVQGSRDEAPVSSSA